MSRHRWIADEVLGDRASLTGDHATHLQRVLRARIGQEFDIVTGKDVRLGRVASIASDRVEFDLGEVLPDTPMAQITLLLAIFKFDRMEWAIEKCTELGVSAIVPLISRRTDSHLAAAAKKRVERWQRIVRQAAEQSRRAAPPQIATPIKVSEALSFTASLRIVLAESEEQTLLADALHASDGESTVWLAVGPEGGWTEDEVRSFREAGWVSASLGNTILRAETAAIAATAIVTSALCSR
jgi:16S rRNA (uracil1498-N3)-methyltransferase